MTDTQLAVLLWAIFLTGACLARNLTSTLILLSLSVFWIIVALI